jgi:hypothetical protein
VSFTGAYQPGLVREHDRLNAIPEAKLREDVRDVGADSRLADEESRRDLGVGEAARDQRQHLELALG